MQQRSNLGCYFNPFQFNISFHILALQIKWLVCIWNATLGWIWLRQKLEKLNNVLVMLLMNSLTSLWHSILIFLKYKIILHFNEKTVLVKASASNKNHVLACLLSFRAILFWLLVSIISQLSEVMDCQLLFIYLFHLTIRYSDTGALS